jgi:ABC-type spermidine/putrescine transport system permease subunit I
MKTAAKIIGVIVLCLSASLVCGVIGFMVAYAIWRHSDSVGAYSFLVIWLVGTIISGGAIIDSVIHHNDDGQ